MSLRQLPEIRAFQRTDALAFEPPSQIAADFDASITAAATDADTSISIYGQIGIDPGTSVDNTERRISNALRAIGKQDITVNLNSPGGNFFSGLVIYNLLRAHPAKVTVNVLGMAGSAASIIAMAGDEILMASGSFIMVHNASAMVIGNKYDTNDATELLSEIDAAMAEVYAARAGVEKKVAAGWMDRRRGDGTMFGASSAIESGLADGRLNADAVKVSAEATKSVPRERVLENALMTAANMSPQEAKALIAEIKSGTREAVGPVTRDADDIRTAIEQLRSTIRS
ncbi:MAG: Clp protease ClpP [Chelatococcus sp.]|uniref:head maturation protease, ClpP-related n=1 Tax=Chelatococcus sp. TaxID=1953771 RepID=UPI0025C593C3|nr:head maturation protease, ClpP-related [Chelatococcus sp.]MBX3537330.1 Clp protease ClpP [Chelatococcus sp.]